MELDKNSLSSEVTLICSNTGYKYSGSVSSHLKMKSVSEVLSGEVPKGLSVSDVKWKISLPRYDIIVNDSSLMFDLCRGSLKGESPISIPIVTVTSDAGGCYKTSLETINVSNTKL